MSDQSPDTAGEQHELVTRFRPRSSRHRAELLSSLDRHFAQTWEHHSDRLLSRKGLDRRKRLLSLAGQYTMLRDADSLRETLEACVDFKVHLREPLEVILQCYIYGGEGLVMKAAQILKDVAEKNDLLSTLDGGPLA